MRSTRKGLKRCCICRRWFIGYGNNPRPVKFEGYCCDKCSKNVILDVRILINMITMPYPEFLGIYYSKKK